MTSDKLEAMTTTSYPTTDALEDELLPMAEACGDAELELVRDLLTYVGEYEHGSVDVEDVSPQMAALPDHAARMAILADVLKDFVGATLITRTEAAR